MIRGFSPSGLRHRYAMPPRGAPAPLRLKPLRGGRTVPNYQLYLKDGVDFYKLND